MFKFSERSIREMEHMHPALILVFSRALELSTIDFGITDGIRTVEESQANIDAGVSFLKNPASSRHVPNSEGIFFAGDVLAYVNGKGTYAWPPYHEIARAMKQASTEIGIPIEWGGDWKSFKDGPHFQLPERLYK